MLSQRVKNNLDAMMQAPGFQVTRSGDTFFATAPGFRKKKLMSQGAVTTPIGQWMRDMRMIPLQPDRVDTTRPTEFRGNSEYALTQSGKRVKLRDTRGLAQRGLQVYQTPELTVEVPATQEGVNASGEQYEIETVKVYTEVEFPEMGELFRQQPTQEQGMRAVVNLFKSKFEENDFMMEESLQIWRYASDRDFVFRIRRRVDNELQVQRLAMRHEQPLRYDWLHTPGMLPEALEIGGKCVTRQVAALLGFPKRIAADLQASWEKFKDAAPFHGQHFETVGVTTEMMEDFAERRGINLIVMHGNRKVVHTFGGSDQFLAYICWDNHAYFVKCARPFTQKPVDTAPVGMELRVQMDRDVKAPTEWQFWDGEIKPGCFIVRQSLEAIRQEWLHEGIVPISNASGFCKFSSIMRCVGDSMMKLKAAPQFFSDISEVMQKLQCPYRLESIGVATLRAIEKLMAPQRDVPTEAEKARVILKQKYQCACCSTVLDGNVACEVDHLPRIAESHETSIQILCASCHSQKSSEELSVGNTFSIQSRFSPHAVKFFKDQAPQAPLVFQHSEPDRGDTWCVDVVRCRANCWKYSSSDWSLFCCLDSIKERTEMQLGDWNWIQAETPTASGAVMRMLPFLSSGWYFRAATAFLLDRGKISWSQVKFVFSSTAHLPHDAFAPAIEKIQQAWEQHPGNTRPKQPTLSKHSINAACGAMEACDKNSNWLCVSSRCEEDISKIMSVATPYFNGVCTDWFEEKPVLSNASYRPIREQILQDESLRMALVLEALDWIPRHHIKFFRTDAIFLQTPRHVTKKAKSALLNATRETLHRPSCWLTFNGPSLVQGTRGEGEMFRVFSCPLPTQQQKGIIFNQRVRTPPHLLPAVQVFREHETNVEELALELAREKRGFLLYGPPGVGKSHLMKRCLQELERVTCCSRTHVASRQFDSGETLSRLKHRIQKGYFKGALCLDECFMCEVSLLDVVAKIALTGAQVIFAGDDAQLAPIGNLWHGIPPPSFLDSDLMRELAPIRIELTICKRSDASLHWFNTLCRTSALDTMMAEARRSFQCEGEPDICLTLDNRRRQEINQRTNERLAPAGSQLLEAEDGPMLLYQGTPLIGSKIAHPILNAIWYEVDSIQGNDLHLFDERGDEVVVSLEKAAKCLTLRHAMTVHKSQSRTLEGHVRICPGARPGHVSHHWSLNHLLVAASRATALANLSIE